MNYYKQYKLYKALSALDIPIQRHELRLEDMYTVSMPGLTVISSCAPVFNSEPDARSYLLTIASNGQVKHIPQTYKNNSFLAFLVFDMLDKKYNEFKGKTK